MAAWYNEIDPFAAAWLRELIKAGHIADGVVDERSIKEVQADDLRGFTQCHFFAGIGGWSYAARLAGWSDDRPLWTGSCPCQPFSVAGKGGGVDDERHLWPDFLRLIRACRPPVVMGEQVAGKAGYGWLDGVRADLAGEDYASRGVDIPACAVDAPHIRQRLYWCAVADTDQPVVQGQPPAGQLRQHEQDHGFGVRPLAYTSRCGSCGRPYEPAGNITYRLEARWNQGADRVAGGDEGCGVDLVDASRLGRREGRAEPEFRSGWPAVAGADARGLLGNAGSERRTEAFGEPSHGASPHQQGAAGGVERPHGADGRNGSFWSGSDWLLCHDQKQRRIPEPGFPLLAHGVSARVAKWRGFGNAIVPQEAAQVIGAFMDAEAGAC